MSYDIVFFDVDGTLLQSDQSICSTTINAINQLQEKNIHVFLATGRPVHAIQSIADKLNLSSFITFNGSYTSHQEANIIHEALQPKLMNQLITIANEYNHELVLYGEEGNYYSRLNGKITKQFIAHFNVKSNYQYSVDQCPNIFGITILNVSQDALDLYNFSEDLTLVPLNIDGFEHSYDVIRTSANKGSAIQKVLKTLDIPLERAIAFGDGLNDIDMFQSVGTRVAMANSHSGLLKHATHQTTANDNQGIYHGLRMLAVIK